MLFNGKITKTLEFTDVCANVGRIPTTSRPNKSPIYLAFSPGGHSGFQMTGRCKWYNPQKSLWLEAKPLDQSETQKNPILNFGALQVRRRD